MAHFTGTALSGAPVRVTPMEGQMASAAQEKVLPRRKLAARPRPDADLKQVRAEITERYKKTLEYLGR